MEKEKWERERGDFWGNIENIWGNIENNMFVYPKSYLRSLVVFPGWDNLPVVAALWRVRKRETF